jgi:hypothetical protein
MWSFFHLVIPGLCWIIFLRAWNIINKTKNKSAHGPTVVALFSVMLQAALSGVFAVFSGNGKDEIVPYAVTNFSELGFPALATFCNFVTCLAVTSDPALTFNAVKYGDCNEERLRRTRWMCCDCFKVSFLLFVGVVIPIDLILGPKAAALTSEGFLGDEFLEYATTVKQVQNGFFGMCFSVLFLAILHEIKKARRTQKVDQEKEWKLIIACGGKDAELVKEEMDAHLRCQTIALWVGLLALSLMCHFLWFVGGYRIWPRGSSLQRTCKGAIGKILHVSAMYSAVRIFDPPGEILKTPWCTKIIVALSSALVATSRSKWNTASFLAENIFRSKSRIAPSSRTEVPIAR